jgi:hypothetical protein
MKTSGRLGNVVATRGAARCFAGLLTALAVALGAGLPGSGHAAGGTESGIVNGVLSAAYFSETCRHQAELLGIARTTDARFLVSAFAQSAAAGPPDARAERRAGSFDVRSGSSGCDQPAAALISLLRLNGVAAELVLVSLQQASSASGPVFSDRVDGVLVYVPALARYVDPAGTDPRRSAMFDRIIKGTAARTHLIGPAPYADPASDPCGNICIREYRPRHNPYFVSVRTETISVP